jgi:hypothetical protein
MSALLSEADILLAVVHVREVPKADVETFMSGTIIGARSRALKRVHDLARMVIGQRGEHLAIAAPHHTRDATLLISRSEPIK